MLGVAFVVMVAVQGAIAYAYRMSDGEHALRMVAYHLARLARGFDQISEAARRADREVKQWHLAIARSGLLLAADDEDTQ